MWLISKRPVRLSLWLVFAVGVIANYYRQVWTVFNLGPEQWARNNVSLARTLKPIWHLIKSGGAVVNLPAFPEAMERTLLAFWGAGLILLSAGALGTLVLRLLATSFQDRREGLLYRISVGLGALSYLWLGLAAFSQYRPPIIQSIAAVLATGGLLWLTYQALFLQKSRQSIREPVQIDSRSFWNRIWQTISIMAVLIALTGALAPEIEFDALRYHLWLPKLWLERGSPVDPINEYVALYPLSWQLLFGSATVLGNAVSAKLLHFTTLPLTALLVYQLTRRFVPGASAWLSVAIFVTIPTVLWEATSAYIDLALAFHIGLVIYALLQYLSIRRWQWLALAGLNLGLALATKHLALLVLVLTSAGLAWILWLEQRSWRTSLIPVAFFAGLSLLIPFPWYFRSWLASGNPVFPDLYGIFGAFPAERWNDVSEQGLSAFKQRFGFPRTPLNLFLLPWNMTIHAARFGGSLGAIFLTLTPGFFWRPFRKAPVSWLMVFSVGYIALWASPLSSFQMRFMVAITPILAVLAALAIEASRCPIAQFRWQKVVSPTLITGLLVLNLPVFTSLHEPDRSKQDGWLTHVIHELPLGVVVGAESQEAYLSRKIPSYRAWQTINQDLPVDALVLTFSDGDHYYGERGRIWSRSPLVGSILQKAAGTNGDQAIEDLRQIGVGYILFDKREIERGDPGATMLRESGPTTTTFETLYEDPNFVLFRID